MRRAQARPTRIIAFGRLEMLLLLLAVTGLVILGWVADPLLLAVVCALELLLAGFGGIALIGPARAERGIARYLVLPIASVALTLSGRLIAPAAVPFLVVGVIAAGTGLWLVLRTELSWGAGERPKTAMDLVLATTLFAASAGIPPAIGAEGWPPALIAVSLIGLVLGLRAAEARGATGGDALGQATLHAVCVAELAAALPLLELPGAIAPAVLALGFYAWSGAADALLAGASRRGVLVEFGLLGALGIIVALLVYGG